MSVDYNLVYTYGILTAWSNVTLHVVDAVGVNLPTGDTELDRADGPVTILIHMQALHYTMLHCMLTVHAYLHQVEWYSFDQTPGWTK